MTSLLWILASLAAALIVVLLAALATPVHFIAAASMKPGFRVTVTARLLGGLAPPIPLHDSARPARDAPAEPTEPSSGGLPQERLTRALAAAPRLLQDLFAAVRLQRIEIDGEVGLDDPADTGQLFGWLSAISRSSSPEGALILNLRPCFDGPRLYGWAEIEASFTPIALLPPGLRFAFAVFGPRT